MPTENFVFPGRGTRAGAGFRKDRRTFSFSARGAGFLVPVFHFLGSGARGGEEIFISSARACASARSFLLFRLGFANPGGVFFFSARICAAGLSWAKPGAFFCFPSRVAVCSGLFSFSGAGAWRSRSQDRLPGRSWRLPARGYPFSERGGWFFECKLGTGRRMDHRLHGLHG